MGPVLGGLLLKAGVPLAVGGISKGISHLMGPSKYEKQLGQYRDRLQALAGGQFTPVQQNYFQKLREQYGRSASAAGNKAGKSFSRRGIGRSPAAATAVSQIRGQYAMQGENQIAGQKMQMQMGAMGKLPGVLQQLAQAENLRDDEVSGFAQGMTQLALQDKDSYNRILSLLTGEEIT